MLRLSEFRLLRPATIEDAVAMLREHDGAVVIAGGTDLVPKMKRGQIEPGTVISLASIAGLDEVTPLEGGLRIGALATLRSLERSTLTRRFGALATAVAQVATPIIRTRATVGGNLLQDTRCRYYDRSHFWREAVDHCLKKDGDVCRVASGGSRCYATFCSDLAPALIVLDARVRLVGADERTVDLEAIYLDDGIEYADTRQRVLVDVSVEDRGYRSSYRKLRMRDSFDFPEVGVAVAMRDHGDRLAVNAAVVGVGSRVVVRKTTCTDADLSLLADEILKDVRPVDTMYFPPAYRKKMAKRMLVKSFDELRAAR